MWSPAPHIVLSTPRPGPAVAIQHPSHVALASAPMGDFEDISSPSLDLQGNEVTDAVATYELDEAGALYELHSPRTELPRLGSPKS
jgi:hypothetical protein